jgi:hypothetical protein
MSTAIAKSFALFAVAAFVCSVSIASPAAAEDGPYVVRMERNESNGFAAIRFNRQSGQTWYLISGIWKSVREEEKVPAGPYDVAFVPMQGNWGAVRFSPSTGRSWMVNQGAWNEIREDSAASQESAAPKE